MNVPSALHFGGLWEAAVKSMKFHMKSVIASQILSQEEFSTSLAEIEAELNSRLLVAASDDPNDFSVITPGHFLIGSELKSVPEPDHTSEKNSHLGTVEISCPNLPIVLEIMVKRLFDSVASAQQVESSQCRVKCE
ncbi:uncharacterized protein NPIL_644481 [Nephila pilipes]|uniref:Uncharacterized protein n=1 Tax=Nephila pilipes TaxID=299642 RepID=A0A8X6PUI6_NEPPI|nr:uncharacterized protein NPIL_644481 [Nephila pilipes]